MKKYLKSCLTKISTYVFLLTILSGSIFLNGCQPKGEESATGGKTIATYSGAPLYYEEVITFMPEGLDAKDSAAFVDRYIEDWFREQVLAEAAYSHVPNMKERIRYQVESNTRNLAAFEYFQWLVETKLDTSIQESEIRNFYLENIDMFKSEAVLYSYFHVKTDHPEHFKVRGWLNDRDQSAIDQAILWCKENALEYRLDSSFVTEEEFSRISKGYYGNLRRAKKNLVHTYHSDEDGKRFNHYFKHLDIIRPGDLLPPRAVRNKIKNEILNQKKNKLLDIYESDLMEQARINRKLNIYPR